MLYLTTSAYNSHSEIKNVNNKSLMGFKIRLLNTLYINCPTIEAFPSKESDTTILNETLRVTLITMSSTAALFNRCAR